MKHSISDGRKVSQHAHSLTPPRPRPPWHLTKNFWRPQANQKPHETVVVVVARLPSTPPPPKHCHSTSSYRKARRLHQQGLGSSPSPPSPPLPHFEALLGTDTLPASFAKKHLQGEQKQLVHLGPNRKWTCRSKKTTATNERTTINKMDGGHNNNDKQLHQHRRLRTTPHPDEPSSDLEERFFGGDDNNHADDFDDSHHHVVVSGSGGGGGSLRQQSRCVSFRRESSEGLSSMGSPGSTLRGSKRGSTDSLQNSAAESTTIPMTTPDGAVRTVRALYTGRVVRP
jgi:hypothetical protein